MLILKALGGSGSGCDCATQHSQQAVPFDVYELISSIDLEFFSHSSSSFTFEQHFGFSSKGQGNLNTLILMDSAVGEEKSN